LENFKSYRFEISERDSENHKNEHLKINENNFTRHRIGFSDSRSLSTIKSESVDLVVTSPPYPMIEIWDSLFASLNPEIGDALERFDGSRAFDLMNQELAKIWAELAES